MNFASKLIVSLITIAATIIGSLWGAFEINDSRMDYKDDKVRKEVLTIVYTLKDERNSLIKAQDDKTSVQLIAIKDEMVEMKKDIRSILTISRKQSGVVNLSERHYTNNESNKKEGTL